VQLNDTLLEVLDQRAVESGRSRSDLIREAIEQYYKEDIEAAIVRAMV
jgi:metal-responsive CopG/Arc/MetJ family transcriptional regulator